MSDDYPGVIQRIIEINGLHMRVAEAGAGPLVVLAHGFPESWHSWRHQMTALAAAGYHAVAPDMRGYGGTDAPQAVESYTVLHLAGDLFGLVEAMGAAKAAIVGHDWGALVAWHAALLRPDRVAALATLSVPYAPRGPAYGMRSTVPPITLLRKMAGDSFFYQLYFQEPGRAEAEMEADIPRTMRMMLVGLSGDATPAERWHPIRPDAAATLVGDMAPPTTLPPWLTEDDIAYLAGEFARTGFRGGLNWYRNIDRNWELLAAYSGATVTVPTLFLWGDRDPLYDIPAARSQLEHLPDMVPNLRTQRFAGCGHWVQQERAEETNAALLAFLRAHYPVGK